VRLAAPLALVVLALAAPASARAAVTIGSNLSGAPVANCTGTCTGVSLGIPAASLAPGGLVAPIDGVVVRWRALSGSMGNGARLRILRPAPGGTSYLGAGTSERVVLSTPGVASEFPVRLPIRAGDAVGLDIESSALVWATTTGATGLTWPALADGTTALGTARPGWELLLQAVVEPDADHDGFGDETQDGCPADATRQAPPCATAPGPPAPGSGPGAARDDVRPVVSGFAVRPSSFRLGRRARIAFRVSERARVSLAFSRLLTGRRHDGRCVARGRRAGRRCTVASPRGTVTLRASGRTVVAFDGRVGGRLLSPGTYRITLTAIDAAGNVSRPRSAQVRLRARARRAGP
jgi:hypothetical protein